MNFIRFKRKIRSINRRFHEARMFARAMRSPRHPVAAHIIPIRRCNLSCTYCNEYDSFSKPVATPEMLRRVDLLAGLGTTIITISGGEPLLHPEVDKIISGIRQHGIVATVITNGYLLTPEGIQRLNRAGLDYLQISIDNLLPDEVSKKNLKVLDQKLRWLAEYAEFGVTVNSVLGYSIRNPEDALVIARRARELGFTSTVGILHDHSGQLHPLTHRQRQIYKEILSLDNPLFSFALYDRFQRNLVQGLPNRWHCRAGSRYLYVCEDGLVHWCSQQRGYPAIPLEQYTAVDLEREWHTEKPCAPYCTVSCVHQVDFLDQLHARPIEALIELLSAGRGEVSHRDFPISVKLLTWMFVTGSQRRMFTRVALRLLGVR